MVKHGIFGGLSGLNIPGPSKKGANRTLRDGEALTPCKGTMQGTQTGRVQVYTILHT